MALYMTQFSYTSEAWAALVKNPEDREAAVRALAEKMGGQVQNLYFSFGEYDGVVLMEAPDETTALAILLAAVTPGHLKATKTTVLIPMKETMAAMGKAAEVVYAAPGE